MAAQSADPCARVAHLAMVRSYQRLLVMLQPCGLPKSLVPVPVTPPAFLVAHPSHTVLAAHSAS